MAQDQMSSLFGTTPEALQAQRDAALQQQAMQYAKMDPFQRSTAAIYSGASRLGTGVAGMMGAQDPEMMRTTQRQALFAKARPSDAAGWQRLAQALNAGGDPLGAQEALAKAASMQKDALAGRKTEADISRANAAANKDNRPDLGTDVMQNAAALAATVGEPGTPEYIKAYKGHLAEALAPKTDKGVKVGVTADGNKLGVYHDAQGQYTWGLDGNGKSVRIPHTGAIDQTTAKTTVTATSASGGVDKGHEKYGDTVGVSAGNRDNAIVSSAVVSSKSLPKLYETRQLLETGAIMTGIGSSIETQFERLRSKFLADEKAGKKVRDSQYLDAMLGSDVFKSISVLGIGARGIDTPAERDFLLRVLTGERTLDKATLLDMINGRIRAAESNVDEFNTALGEGELDRWQKYSGSKLKAFPKPPQAPRPAVESIPGQNPRAATPQPTGKPTVSGWNR